MWCAADTVISMIMMIRVIHVQKEYLIKQLSTKYNFFKKCTQILYILKKKKKKKIAIFKHNWRLTGHHLLLLHKLYCRGI